MFLYLALLQFRVRGWREALLAALVAAVCIWLPAGAARWPVMAAYVRVREIPAGALRSSGRLAENVIGAALRVWPVTVAVAAGASPAGRAALLLGGYLLADPLLGGLLAPVSAGLRGGVGLPAGYRARLAGLAGLVGVRAQARMIRATARREAGAILVGWLPGLRYVLVTDYLLDQLPARRRPMRSWRRRLPAVGVAASCPA